MVGETLCEVRLFLKPVEDRILTSLGDYGLQQQSFIMGDEPTPHNKLAE